MSVLSVYIATVRSFGARLEGPGLPLSDEERARAARFHHMSDRWEFVLGRLMARSLLAQRTGTPPREVRLVENEHGRPEIAFPDLDRPIRFNLSHSGGLVGCIVGGPQQVGIDIERLDRPAVDPRVIRRYCSEPEQQALAGLPEAVRHERFLQLWTLKEAYVKARGTGLTLPLRRVSFALGAEGPGDVAFDGMDDARRWIFAQSRLEPRHLMAIAAEREPDEEIEIEVLTFTPGDAGLA